MALEVKVPARGALEVRPVAGKRELDTFIKLPWRLYRNERNWVAPLLFDRKRFLDRSRNPFFKHAEAEFFLAWRGATPVGRLSAHIDRHFNEFQHHKWGMFGFFECENDPEAAGALLSAASTWLAARGRDRMVGPMDFTTNDECGVLVDGYDLLPTVLTNWHHPYYPGLLEGAGMTKAMDLYMWSLDVANRASVHPAIWRVADEVESKYGIKTRNMRKKDMQAEIGRFLEVYNAAWERNWGFVPLTEEEVRHYAKDLKPVLDENWAFIAEKDGEPVGAALTLPDYNQVLLHLNGRLLPLGWAKALWYRRKIDRVRAFALGVKPEYQHTGVGAKLYQMHWEAGERTRQKRGETGWTLESNKAMNRAMERMGGKIIRTYRVYERRFEDDGRRCHHVAPMSESEPLAADEPTAADMDRPAPDPPTPNAEAIPEPGFEVVDGVPVLAEVRTVERPSASPLPVVQVAAVAATGFVAGAATVVLVKRRSGRKHARKARSGPRRPVDMLPIAASRSFLVDVHVIAKPR
ncbi:MAG: GNAT family N-acetyltransferase [Solirubrobacterales bacterium]|nr:GNAT family N-acetyltransferase [Solirubrobacterales bacterium]